jgi:hypothetical protein
VINLCIAQKDANTATIAEAVVAQSGIDIFFPLLYATIATPFRTILEVESNTVGEL